MLEELLLLISVKAFAGLLVIAVADLLELPPFRQKLIFLQCSDKDSMKHL